MIDQTTRDAYAASSLYLPTHLRAFQFFDKYSRFDYDQGRRETWVETVDRSIKFFRDALPILGNAPELERVREGILGMRITPSMRLFATAGEAARRNNIAVYNCSYMPVDDLRAFSEALLISMSGCGVGFSVESKYVSQLPRVQRVYASPPVHVHVEDTTEGWQRALLTAITAWMSGSGVRLDTDDVRAAGSPLRVKGGVASGPKPFEKALEKIKWIIRARAGKSLRPIDAHDIMCHVGSAAVSGGHRRTAMISLFDADDQEMLHAKDAGFDAENPQRWNANNSAVWPDSPTRLAFDSQMDALFDHGTGEPGIFSRAVAVATMPERRSREWESHMGTNPCGEVVLRPWQFCNLSAVVARKDDTIETLREKVELATIVGTWQSALTHFPGLRPQWTANCNEERLLGVDITGQLDCPMVRDAQVLDSLKALSVETNRVWAARLGINQSAAVTVVKPSGNTSQLVDCASGLHARWAPYYVRNVRVSAHSPIFKTLQEYGVPMSPENGQDEDTADTWVVSFPVKSPEGAITRNDRSAVEQCNYWLLNKLHWTEHNPSVTITYRPDEIPAVRAWIWENRDRIGGMAFLPSFDGKYDQLPYIECTEDEYEDLKAQWPDEIDWSLIAVFEGGTDQTEASTTLACESDLCLLTPGA